MEVSLIPTVVRRFSNVFVGCEIVAVSKDDVGKMKARDKLIKSAIKGIRTKRGTKILKPLDFRQKLPPKSFPFPSIPFSVLVLEIVAPLCSFLQIYFSKGLFSFNSYTI